MHTRAIGSKGEDLAKEFLKKQEYEILDTNAHKRFGEIDLVVKDPKTKEIVFVEVKWRKNNHFGYPEEFVDRKKLMRLKKAAQLWILANKKIEADQRMDVIAITDTPSAPILEHFKNIGQDGE